jgi:23S rRNA-/tRNA-specific pseudouridylate synthase
MRGKGQVAITDYETVLTDERGSVLRLTLQTGRKHQIRTQLAGKGTPIVNDVVYNAMPPTGPLRLVAVELGFEHPGRGERVTFALPTEGRQRLGAT